MLSYEGQPCIKCGKPFTADDDIVVCPECGTPYHRACYKEAGTCINTDLHRQHISWQDQRAEQVKKEFSEQKKEEIAQQEAARERGEEDAPMLYDGVRIRPDDPCIGLDPEENFDGAPLRDVSEFVNSNRLYYLPLFHWMKRTGKKVSFNFVCLFFPELYFANRKMWGVTLLVILLRALLFLPDNLEFLVTGMQVNFSWVDTTSSVFQTVSMISTMLWMGATLVLCLFANRFYYRFAVRSVTRIRKTVLTPSGGAVAPDAELRLKNTLRRAGGTSVLNIVLAVMIDGAVSAATLALLMLFP